MLVACAHESVLFNHKTRKRVIDNIIEHLLPHKDEFEAIAVSGYSMAIMGSIIATMLNKNIILVRKSGEPSFSNLRIEGITGQKYIIIDDLIDSGATFARITRECKTFACKFVGYGLWNSSMHQELIDKTLDGIVNYKIKCYFKFSSLDIVDKTIPVAKTTDEMSFRKR